VTTPEADAVEDRWICASDRLPEEGVEVLVWTGWVMTAMWNGAQWREYGDANPVFMVTHWQPLPTPPKEADRE
jgi:hypothetical protein